MNEALQVLHDLNEIRNLGDFIYDIREREGLGWEGPKVQAWSDACKRATQLLQGYNP